MDMPELSFDAPPSFGQEEEQPTVESPATEDMPLGVFPDMPNEVYHSSSAVSKSVLDRVAISPSHCWYYMQQGGVSSPAMRFGSLFHDLTLMGREFALKHYPIQPEDMDLRTKSGREERDTWLEMLADWQIPMTREDWDIAEAMRDSVMMNPDAKWLIEQSQLEASHFWIDDETFTHCRCRPDINGIEKTGIIGDLKSTTDCSPLAFQKSVDLFRYDVQDAMYSDGLLQTTGIKAKAFWFIATEKKAEKPVTVIYTLPDREKERGWFLYRRDIETYAEAAENNSWTSPADIHMKEWAFNVMER